MVTSSQLEATFLHQIFNWLSCLNETVPLYCWALEELNKCDPTIGGPISAAEQEAFMGGKQVKKHCSYARFYRAFSSHRGDAINVQTQQNKGLNADEIYHDVTSINCFNPRHPE